MGKLKQPGVPSNVSEKKTGQQPGGFLWRLDDKFCKINWIEFGG
jgi:hypothetical protein